MSSYLKPPLQFSPDFTQGLLSKEFWQFDRMVPRHWKKMPTVPIYGKTHKTCSSPQIRQLWSWIIVYTIGDSMSTKRVQMIIVGWLLTFLRQGQICASLHLYGENAEKTFSLYVLKTNGRNLQCMIKVVNPFCYNQDCVPCCWAIYWYEIMFHKISHGAFCRRDLDFFFNRSNSLNKFAAMPIYGKTRLKIYFSRTKKALWLVVGI